MSFDRLSPRHRWTFLALFVGLGTVIGLDLREDLLGGEPLVHVAVEGAVMVAVAASGVLMGRRLSQVRREVRVLRRDLEVARHDADRWREDARAALEGLGVAIQHQFERWALTPAEAEVALLLLKGLSHKDVADVRETSERTVRHQALAVYRKANLAGRAELSAFFLEDLLLPRTEARDANGRR